MFVPSFISLSVKFMELGSKFCVKVYKTLHDRDPLMDFILFGMMVETGLVLLTVIPTLGPDLEVKVTDV